ADAARGRPAVAAAVAEPGGHGLRGPQGGGGARHRARLRGPADAARAARGQHLFELPRGEPGAVAADAAAAGGEDPRRPGGRAEAVVAEAGAFGRSRPRAGAGGGPRAAVGASERCRLPERRRETRAAGAGAREQTMNHEDMLARLMAQAVDEGGDLVTLRAIVEEASELAARRGLGRLGLGDDGAEKDIDELRELLAAWR